MMLVVLLGPAMALDANAQGSAASGTSSMEDVARLIRKTKWRILGAAPRREGSETRYRFKLISNTGKVKIISVDPKRPNLRRLEQ